MNRQNRTHDNHVSILQSGKLKSIEGDVVWEISSQPIIIVFNMFLSGGKLYTLIVWHQHKLVKRCLKRKLVLKNCSHRFTKHRYRFYALIHLPFMIYFADVTWLHAGCWHKIRLFLIVLPPLNSTEWSLLLMVVAKKRKKNSKRTKESVTRRKYFLQVWKK